MLVHQRVHVFFSPSCLQFQNNCVFQHVQITVQKSGTHPEPANTRSPQKGWSQGQRRFRKGCLFIFIYITSFLYIKKCSNVLGKEVSYGLCTFVCPLVI